MINDSYSTCNTIRTLRIKTDKPLQTVKTHIRCCRMFVCVEVL